MRFGTRRQREDTRSPRFTCREDHFSTLRDHLFISSGVEQFGFGFVGVSAGPEGPEYLLHRLVLSGPDDYIRREGAFLRLRPEFVLRVIDAFMDCEALGVIEFHSHPFSRRASFSGTDLRFLPDAVYDFTVRKEGAFYLWCVMGTDERGFTMEIVDPDDVRNRIPVTDLRLVGRGGIRPVRGWRSGALMRAGGCERQR
jgi:hypothetical protein